ncbi:MAG: aminotransferase class III-fold pyridoxal phosphate-dependent enzyme [Nannocystaceae bacterium]
MSVDPEPDLAELEARQRREAPAPGVPIERETTRVKRPKNDVLLRSEALLERLHAGDFVPRERAPMVVDTRRSSGPFLASIDDAPRVILDASSQIATLTHGFAHPGILRGLDDGDFAGCLWSNPDTAVHHVPEVAAYAEALRRVVPVGLVHVSMVAGGGSEANEKALRIARLHAPAPADGRARTRVIALEGSFHGRTWASVQATGRSDARGGFLLPGFEAVFIAPTIEALERALDEHGDEVYAVIVESMLAGGDDVAIPRAFLLDALARARSRGIPFVVDEVQTGGGTGGPIFWWQRLGLGGDADSTPDLITTGKKAGLGVVLSRWPDPEANQISVASAVRGRIQLESAHAQGPIEALLAARVPALADASGLVRGVRIAGTTFALDLVDAAAASIFLERRLAHGFLSLPTSTATVRFRLSASWTAAHVDDLCRRIAAALGDVEGIRARGSAMEIEAGASASDQPSRRAVHHDLEAGVDRSRGGREPTDPVGAPDFEITPIGPAEWDQIIEIENAAYEPARRDSMAILRGITAAGLGVVAVDTGTREVLGYAFCAPCEHFPGVAGPAFDPAYGRGVSVFSADITVTERARGRGIGRALKRAQTGWARERGYHYLSGCNRVGAAGPMSALNASLGAFPIARLDRQYEGDAQADYYRIPLQAPADPPVNPGTAGRVDLASGIQQPLGERPVRMARREWSGPLAAKLNLSRYATLDLVHYVEHLRAIAPRGTRHLHLSSSRDEMLDKALRCLRLGREGATIAVGLAGGYVGHVTAAARSISDPAGFGPALGLFPWPRLPHPAIAGIDRTLAALDALVVERGAGSIFAIVAEVVGERSGLCLDGDDARALADACRRHDLPLVLVETASGGYRSGGGAAWGVDHLPAEVVPDLVLWYGGGQLGHVFVGDRYYVDRPGALVSTWDGDEVSMIRAHEHLRAAHRLDLGPAIAALEALIAEQFTGRFRGVRVGGRGLFRAVSFADPTVAGAILQLCQRRGIYFGRGLPGTLTLSPSLDVDPALLRGRLRDELAPLLGDLIAGGVE